VIVWDVSPCCLVNCYQLFGETALLTLVQDTKIFRQTDPHIVSWVTSPMPVPKKDGTSIIHNQCAVLLLGPLERNRAHKTQNRNKVYRTTTQQVSIHRREDKKQIYSSKTTEAGNRFRNTTVCLQYISRQTS
jgi:hypothetical protein